MTGKKLLSGLAGALLLFIMLLFLSAPARYAESIRTGISLWAVSVLPAAFPFLFLTALLTNLPVYRFFSEKISPLAARAFRISGAGGGAAVLAALSGYPVGAKMVADLKTGGRITESETFRLSCLASTSGPAFLVGTVGSLLYHSAAHGQILLISHLAAVWIVCFLLRLLAKPETVSPAPIGTKRDSDPLWSSIVSVLSVGGLIALFSCLCDMLSDLGLFRLFGDSLYTEGILRGLLEMTGGCAALAKTPTPLSLALSAGLVTFGGACVLSQELSFLTKAGVKALPFLAVKLLQGALAFGICYLLARII